MSIKSEVLKEENSLKSTAVICSCKDCDSGTCFEKRYQASKQCTCNKCNDSKTRLFYSNKTLKESVSDVAIKTTKNCNTNTRPISKVKCINQGLETTKVTSYTSSTVDKGNQKECTKDETYYESDGMNTLIHKQSKYSKRMPEQRTGSVTENEVTVVQSVTVTYSNADISSSTAKLSAQIMNVPYKDFKNTISFSKPEKSKTKLTKYDILQRIKDAYNACSCKVCECIANVSPVQEEICNCKPCDCDDCRIIKSKLNNTQSKMKENVKSFFDKAFETCSETLSQNQCNCKPCECVECNRLESAVACNCKPCECVQCKSMGKRRPIKTIIVAPVEDSQRRYCQCNPCGCFECGHIYGTINPNLTREMSTGVSRHPTCRCETCMNEACERDGVDACHCDRRSKVMRKPVERDTHDFDIRRTDVSSNKDQYEERRKSRNNETITMFAALPQCFPGKERGCTNDKYDSAECECKDIVNAIPTPRKTALLKNVYNLPNKPNACECAPCDCDICTNRDVSEQNVNCKCGVCDCIHCANLARPFYTNENVIMKPLSISPSKNCDCEPCDCIECQKENYNNRNGWILNTKTSEIVHPIKRGRLLKQPVSKINDMGRNMNIRCYANKSISPYSQISINKTSEDMLVYHAFPHHKKSYQDNSIRNSNPKPITLQSRTRCEKDATTNHKKSTVEFDKTIQFKNKEILSSICNSKDCQASESYVSALTSCATTSRISYNNESGSISPVSLKRHRKSWDGSCNSSGHDHSDYLIRFPRKTVETCINEVMNLSYDRKFKFNHLNMKSNPGNNNTSCRPSYLQCKHASCSRSHNMNPIPAGQIYYPKLCRNWNIENACGCDQCYCDKCSFKKLQFNKCKCACDSCNCCGMCLGEDVSILIRKNETAQTDQKFVSDRGQDSADDKITSKANCVFVSKAKIQTDLEELEVSKDDNNLIQKDKPKALDNSFTTGNDIYKFVKDDFRRWGYGYQALNPYLNNNVDLLGVNIYESVHRTIKEARAFSLDLMNILQKYEKANREFESVSQKLKESHKAILDSYNAQNKKDNEEMETNQSQKNYDNKARKIEINANVKHEHDLNTRNKAKETVVDKSKVDFHKNQDDAEIHHKHENTNDNITTISVHNENAKTYTPECFPCDTVNCYKSSKCSDDAINEKHNTKNDNVKTLESGALDIIDEVLTSIDIDPNNTRQENRTYKKYRKLIKGAVVIAKRNSIKNDNSSEPSIKSDSSLQKNNEEKLTTSLSKAVTQINVDLPIITTSEVGGVSSIKQTSERNGVIKDADQINLHVPTKTASIDLKLNSEVPCETLEDLNEIKSCVQNQDINITKKPKQAEELKTWQKNFGLNTMPFDKFQVNKTPYLEVEVNGSVNCQLQETGKTIETAQAIAIPYENKAMMRLLAEVKKMQDMPLLQITSEETSEKDKNTSNMEFDMSSFSFSQIQSLPKRKSDDEASSCSRATYSMIAQPDNLNIPAFKNFRSKLEVKSGHEQTSGTCSPTTAKVDATKVQFETVRRVSDHTILVKWKAPRDKTDVKGYELLVDGRAVKKILSATRCMAVVTCLPHSEQVTLTIRTISATSQHLPRFTTTLLYRSRTK